MAKTDKPTRIMIDAAGQHVPVEYVKPYDRERDRVARRIEKRWAKANAYLARVKADTLNDVAALQRFGLKDGEQVGGAKGNVQFSSFDALIRVRIDARTMVDFDDRFRQAQAMIFEYVDELTGATDQADVATIIKAAFRPSSAGMLARAKIMGLLRLNIKADKWVRAMELLRESQLVKAGKSYVYVETRPTLAADFEMIPLDVAAIDPATTEQEESARPVDAPTAQ